MCLRIDKLERVSVAKEDIVCYKILIRRKNGEYSTFYRDFVVDMGITYQSRLARLRCNNYDIIEQGLHVFVHKSDTLHFESKMDSTVRVVRCVIPKESLYYKGIFERCESYASNHLRYEEIIT